MRQLFLPLFILSLVFVFFTLMWFGFNVYLGANHAYEQLDKEAARQTKNNTGQTSTQSITKPRAKPQAAPPSLQHAAPSDLPEAADAEALMARAEAGDVVAQQKLAELYSLCGNWLASRDIYQGAEQQAIQTGVESTASLYLKNMGRETQFKNTLSLSEVICTQSILSEGLAYDAATGIIATKQWAERAAKQGDLEARVIHAAHSSSRTSMQPLLEEIVLAQNPDALLLFFIHGLELRGNIQLAPTLSHTDLEWQQTGWSIAACRLGASGCGANAHRTRNLCMFVFLCGYPSLEAALMDAYVPPANRFWMEQYIQRIMDAYRSGDVWETEQTTP